MLRSLKNSFRNFVLGDENPEGRPTRKRSLDSVSEDVFTTPVKKARTENTNKGSWIDVSKVAEWVTRRGSSFSNNYYFKAIVNSPKHIAKKLKRYTSTESLDNPGPPVRVIRSNSEIPQFSAEMSERPRMPPGIPAQGGPAGMPNVRFTNHPPQMPNPGYQFERARMDINRPNAFQFATPDTSYTFRAPQQSGYMQHTRPPITRQPLRAHGAGHNVAARSMYDKTFSKRKNKMAAMESIQIEERNRYAEILQQFTKVPLTACFSGTTGSSRKPAPVSRSSSQSSGNDVTILGTSVTPISFPSKSERIQSLKSARTISISSNSSNNSNHSLSSRSTSERPFTRQTVSDKTVHANVEPTKSLPQVGLSQKSFLELTSMRNKDLDVRPKERKSAYKSFGAVPPRNLVVDLVDSDDDVQITSSESVKSPPQTLPLSCKSTPSFKPSSQPLEISKSPTSEQVSRILNESPFTSDDWLSDMRNKYADSVRRRQREIKESQMKVEFFKEKREQWDEYLEQSVRDRLRLSEREPPVLHDEYSSEEESEEEEDEFPELDDDQQCMVDEALGRGSGGQVLSEAFRLQITRSDMHTLAGLNWLNDEVINFYMNMLIERGNQDNRPKVHAFNTFFYPKIMGSGHSSVRRWTKKVDVFAMDYILVPVHLGMHWCLSVIDMRKKEIRYYDSMGGNNDRCLNALKQYLSDESMDKKKQPYDTSDWKLINVKGIPQQMNGSDCGMFACKFAEYITRDADTTFSQEQMPYFRRRMVYEILTKELM